MVTHVDITSEFTAIVLSLIYLCVGLRNTDRTEIQRQWMSGLVPVIVATVSFGMGVDKANVRYILCSLLDKMH